MDPAVANAVDELLDEVDEEEAAAEEDFSHRDSVKVVARALDAFADLEVAASSVFKKKPGAQINIRLQHESLRPFKPMLTDYKTNCIDREQWATFS